MLSRNDLKILNCLNTTDCSNPLKAFTVPRIEKETGFKTTKIRYILRSLTVAGYINEGCCIGNAKTYYITSKGKETIMEVLLQ